MKVFMYIEMSFGATYVQQIFHKKEDALRCATKRIIKQLHWYKQCHYNDGPEVCQKWMAPITDAMAQEKLELAMKKFNEKFPGYYLRVDECDVL